MKKRKGFAVTIFMVLLFVFTTNFMVMEAMAQTELKKVYIKVNQNNAGEIISVEPTSSHSNEYDITYTTNYSELAERTEISVTVTAKENYVFYNDFATKSQYSITGATFQSGHRVNESTVKVELRCNKRLKGQLDTPTGLYWEDDYGLATWDEVDEADYYTVSINSNNITVYDTVVNLNSYLKDKKSNKFRVKACSNDSYLTNSLWSEYSDELYYERDYWDYGDYWYNDDYYYNYPPYSYSHGQNNGWVKVGDIWYYYVNGRKVTSTIYNVDGRSYLFDGTGRMLTGWQSYQGSTYYFYPQGSGNIKQGEMARGWVYVEGTWYFYDRSTGKEVHNKVVEGFYLGSGGNILTNQWVGDRYVDESGKIVTNTWKLIQQRWFYFDSNGYCVKGRIEVINGLPYPFDNSGALVYGWFNYNGYSYYVKPDGNIARNEYINGYWVDQYGRWVWY